MLTFDEINETAIRNGSYDALSLDVNNDIGLNLLADGVTAVVSKRFNGMFVTLGTFERETYFSGGHWSDIDISEALMIANKG